jgi:hypothetical protein
MRQIAPLRHIVISLKYTQAGFITIPMTQCPLFIIHYSYLEGDVSGSNSINQN